MKKIVSIIVIVSFLCISLVACAAVNVPKQENPNETSMFVMVERSTLGWYIVYDVETKVMYAVSNGGYNVGNFTLLVNADGSPKLWEGW